MKNGKIKPNKTKIVARVMLVVLLFSSAINLVGCAKIPDGYYYPNDFEFYLSQETRGDDSSIIKIWATSDSNIFDMNDITFNLLYGTHANQYIGRQNIKKYEIDKYRYYIANEDDSCVFALYICDDEFRDVFIPDEYNVDSTNIQNIPNHKFISSMDEEKAFSEEYGYIVKSNFIFSPSFYYKHIESITIPQEYIENTCGRFVIKLVLFSKNIEEQLYLSQKIEHIVFEYEKLDDGTVSIKFKTNTK